MPICDFCNRSGSIKTSQEEGWTPYYYRQGDGDAASGGPCCPKCFDKHLRVSPVDGEYEQVARYCPVKEVHRVRMIVRADSRGLISAYEAYAALRECGITERRALAMLLGGKD